MIFASEKLENLDNLVNAVANMTINGVIYELNTATTSDAQFEFASNTDKITHTRNGDTHQKVLSSRMIRIFHEDMSVFSPPTDTKIGTNN